MRMKSLAVAFSAGLVVVSLATAPFSKAFADQQEQENQFFNNHYRGEHNHFPGHPDPPRVPELDPGLAISGVAMLGGGLLVLADRFRRRKKGK
jgi:hypothetical protein